MGRKPVAALGLAAYAVRWRRSRHDLAWAVRNCSGFGLFVALMLTRAIFGAFGSASSPAAQAYIADRTTIFERTEQLAGLTAAFALGQAFGPAICAALAAWRLGVSDRTDRALAAGAASSIWRYLPENTPPKVERPRGEWRASLALMNDRRLGFLIYGFGLSLVTGITLQVFGLFTMDRLDVYGAHGAELSAVGFMVNAMTLLATQMAILPRLRLGLAHADGRGRGPDRGWRRSADCGADALARCWSSQVMQGLGLRDWRARLHRRRIDGGAPRRAGAAAGLVVAMNGAGFVVLADGRAASPTNAFGMDVPLVRVGRLAAGDGCVRADEPAAAQRSLSTARRRAIQRALAPQPRARLPARHRWRDRALPAHGGVRTREWRRGRWGRCVRRRRRRRNPAG